jgi:hypothetical protein
MRSGSLAPGGSVAPLREKRASRFSALQTLASDEEKKSLRPTPRYRTHAESDSGHASAYLLQRRGGFEPSGRLATASDFRDRAEPAAMPHRNWSPHPGGMQGE